jgi:hypothetical protein
VSHSDCAMWVAYDDEEWDYLREEAESREEWRVMLWVAQWT